jgi:hypothetical protein
MHEMMPYSTNFKSAGIVLATTIALLMTVSPVMADGVKTAAPEKKVTKKEVCVTQYGGGTECKIEEVTEEIIHDTRDIKAGVGDLNWLHVAAALSVAGVGLGLLSKMTQRVYLFE